MTSDSYLTQRTTENRPHISDWIAEFIYDCKIRNLRPGTIKFYSNKLTKFSAFCNKSQCKYVEEINSILLRHFFNYLDVNGHNSGGKHAYYRAIKALINWWEREENPESFKNPLNKIKAPKVPIRQIEGIKKNDFEKMISVCDQSSIFGVRDRAILFTLLDTGLRANELCGLNLSDVDRVCRTATVRKSKSGRPRAVYFGKKSSKEIKSYLRLRKGNNDALFLNKSNFRLKYGGLRGIIARRSFSAGVKRPQIHDFRRTFALECLRNGMNVFALQRLMGHSDIQVLRRYLAQTSDDLRNAHTHYGPFSKI
jgi:site-specific recombinase XerD